MRELEEAFGGAHYKRSTKVDQIFKLKIASDYNQKSVTKILP